MARRSGRHGHGVRPRRDHDDPARIAGRIAALRERARPLELAIRAAGCTAARASSAAAASRRLSHLERPAAADAPRPRRAARGRASCRRRGSSPPARGDAVVVDAVQVAVQPEVGAAAAGRRRRCRSSRCRCARRSADRRCFTLGAKWVTTTVASQPSRGRFSSASSQARQASASARTASASNGRPSGVACISVDEVAAGAHRLGAAGRRRTGRSRTSASCRRCGCARPSVVGDDEALALEHRDAELARSARAAPASRVVEVAAVELVVAGDEDDRLRPAAKALERRPSGCRCRRRGRAARRRAPARGSYDSVSRCRSDSSCSRIRPTRRQAAPWHCLNLLAAAARARIVAADLGRVAPHRVDLVAQRPRQVVQVGDAGDELVDRVVERSERPLAWRASAAVALLVASRPAGSDTGAPAPSPPRRRRARRGRQKMRRRARSRRPRAGSRRRDRARAPAPGRVGLGRRLRPRLLVVELEDERIEAAEFGQRAIQRRVAAQDQRAGAPLLRREARPRPSDGRRRRRRSGSQRSTSSSSGWTMTPQRKPSSMTASSGSSGSGIAASSSSSSANSASLRSCAGGARRRRATAAPTRAGSSADAPAIVSRRAARRCAAAPRGSSAGR